MTMPNKTVAERFVAGRPASGSHFSCAISILGNICSSYTTRIAFIKEGRLFMDVAGYSTTTRQHKRHITSAWGRRQVAKGLPYDAGVFWMKELFGGASDTNVRYWVDKADAHMGHVLNNRCRPNTRYFAFCDVHRAVQRAAEVFYLLDGNTAHPLPTTSLIHRLKCFTELCAAVPVHEAVTAEQARLSSEQIVTIRAISELMRE